jgi:hypothetical protein
MMKPKEEEKKFEANATVFTTGSSGYRSDVGVYQTGTFKGKFVLFLK